MTIQINWQHRVNKTKKNKNNNPDKLATQGKQDEEKQSKNATEYVLDTTHRQK